MRPKQLFDLCRKSVDAWIDDFAPSMGAAIAYYTMFSLAPLLVIVIAIAGAVFGHEAVQGEIVAQLSGLIGREGAIAVQGLVRSASEPERGLIAGGISLVVLLIGATTVFAELQSALDRIWHVPEREKPTGVWAVLRARLLSFGLILALAFLLMVSLVVSAGVAAFGTWAGTLLPGAEFLLQIANLLVSMGIMTVLFAMIYKFMPTAPIGWHDVWVGAFVTAVLFELGKLLIGLYIGKSGMTESFAAAGSLVVLLAWVYYAAQIFLLGAEFTKVHADAHGSRAGEKAVAATQVEVEEKKMGTDRIDPHGQPLEPVALASKKMPADKALALEEKTRHDVELRLERGTRLLVRELVFLVAVSLGNAAVLRWKQKKNKAARAARAQAKRHADHAA